MLTFDELVSEYLTVLRLHHRPNSPKLDEAIKRFLDTLSNRKPVSVEERRIRLLALVNAKFDINKGPLDALFAACARAGLTFNYREKLRLSEAFDRSDRGAFDQIFAARGISSSDFGPFFCPMSPDETVACLHTELTTPTLVRKDSKPRDWSQEIKGSLLGGFAFCAFPIEAAHSVFDTRQPGEAYEPDFWRYLHRQVGGRFSREKSLTYIRLKPDVSLDDIAAAVSNEFDTISNHGHLALHFAGWNGDSTRVAGLVTVFAEKFSRQPLKGAYFKWQEIEEATRACVPLEVDADYGFRFADLGFQYRDTFVFANGDATDLLLIFQKNVADECLIICPSCRSHDVQGNSYSSLGVKSWECNNLLCPSRSKFNRGKRYSFHQLLKQEAIEVEENQIPRESVRAWARDVQPNASITDILPMLVRHYSLAGDGVLVVGSDDPAADHRRVTRLSNPAYFTSVRRPGLLEEFRRNPLFARCTVSTAPKPEKPTRSITVDDVLALEGDSNHVLYSLGADSIDGAVTSPPYYNAREYSQWSNIYCYLHDMFNNARAVFRVLKPGALYLFNIFDYFDNENTIALSAMGQKRMILSAYCVDLFERVGFECVGNVVWDKGDIEGKRGFNGGNFSPYYQSPFNCWEHVLVFRKPGAEDWLTGPLPTILRAKPVIKIVKGENRHGHTAPFPEALPKLLLDRLPAGSTVLDPYAGSMTTGVAAVRTGHKAVCIEQASDYFNLGVSMLKDAASQRSLL